MCNVRKKRDVNDRSFAHITLILLLHYLVKCRSVVWPFTTMNSYCVQCVVHAPLKLGVKWMGHTIASSVWDRCCFLTFMQHLEASFSFFCFVCQSLQTGINSERLWQWILSGPAVSSCHSSISALLMCSEWCVSLWCNSLVLRKVSLTWLLLLSSTHYGTCGHALRTRLLLSSSISSIL